MDTQELHKQQDAMIKYLIKTAKESNQNGGYINDLLNVIEMLFRVEDSIAQRTATNED